MSKAMMGPVVPPVYVGTTASGRTYIAATELTMEELTKARDILVRILARREAGEAPAVKRKKKKKG